jgi:hypothetical protein
VWLADPGSISFLANEADQILSQRGSEQAFRRRGLAQVDSDLDSAGYGFESESLINDVRDRVGKVGEEYDVLGRPLLREGVVCSGCRDGRTISLAAARGWGEDRADPRHRRDTDKPEALP